MAIGIILGIVFFTLIVGGFIAAGALFDNCHTLVRQKRYAALAHTTTYG